MTTKTKGPELLPEELLWAEGGHASDIVLTTMADGQAEILPRSVLAHVNGCLTCTTHLGNAALLSLHTGRELNVLSRAAAASEVPKRAPLPRLAIALGLAFAALGLVPSMLDAPAQIGAARAFATHDAPLLVAGLGTLRHKLLEPGSTIGIALTYGAALMVIVMGFALVRLVPKKEVSR
jgi:hypothetical protein